MLPSAAQFRTSLRAAVWLVASTLTLSACGGGSTPPTGPSVDPVVIQPEQPPVGNLPPVDVSAVALADPGSALPDGWQNGAFMQIFVRSYQDSDGDGRGDLRGLIQRLDYLKNLGVRGLWLMPVTQSQDKDHGYAVSDYRNIEAHYGSLADFDELLKQAHARGIGVIVDYVINHSAAENALFVQSKSANSNAYRDWYLWSGIRPTGWFIYGNDPWKGSPGNYYFAPFWDQMPDFNLTNPKVTAWHMDNLRFWMNRGVDGFRFDAVGNLFENGASAWENQAQNYQLLRSTRQMMDGYAKRFLVCEGPSDPNGYTAACGSAFAFNNTANIFSAAKGEAMGVQRVAAFHATAAAGATSRMSTMLSNHDGFAGQRAYDQLNGNTAQMKLAAATYLLQPGTPFIYYGEEIGMAGGGTLSGDAKLRTPMSWNNSIANVGFSTGTPYRSLSANLSNFNVTAELADPNSMLAFYTAMLALRNSIPALTSGSYEAVTVNGSVMTFQRRVGGSTAVVAINYGTSAATVSVTGLTANGMLATAYPGSVADVSIDASGQASITLGAQAVRVLTLR
jgi:alpha-amylase